MIYDGGIFRDVFLTSAPLVQLYDYTVITDLDDSYTNATLKLSVDVRNLASASVSGYTVEAQAIDRSGKNILGSASASLGSVGAGEKATAKIEQLRNDPMRSCSL